MGVPVKTPSAAFGGRAFVEKLLAICFWLVVWQVASVLVGSSLLLPGPVQVVRALVDGIVTAEFWSSVAFSFSRIATGFAVSLFLALVLAVGAWRCRALRALLAPAVSFIKSVPVVCIIVLLLMWAGAAGVSSLAVGLMVFPMVYAACLEGLTQTDASVAGGLRLLGVGPWRRVRYYYLPAVMPYLSSAARVVVGVAWKSGVAAEVIGIPDGSIGEGIYSAKIGLETADLFAWTFAIVAMSAVCERLFFALMGLVGRTARRVRVPRRITCSRTDCSVVGLPVGAAPAHVRFSDVSFSYGEPSLGDSASIGSRSAGEVIRGLSLDVAAGERLCVMGPSGVGKSTLLDLACGLLRPTSGTVESAFPAGRVFQEDRLLGQMSAWQNVVLVAVGNVARSRRADTNAPDAGRLDAGPARTDLSCMKRELDELIGCDSDTVTPDQMSGGMRRKAALVRALVAPGGAAVLDEPFAGLDEASRQAALALIERYLDGRTLIVATHDARDAEALGARMLTLGGAPAAPSGL